MKEHEEGYSMPLAAPTYTRPPFYATPDSRIMMMAYRADPAAVAFEVPEPLEPVEPNLMLAWIGDMGQPTHSVELYHECLTGIQVRFKEWTGWYINYIWVDNDMALTFEREIYGWPANLCETTPLTFYGSQVIGHCDRAGERLMRLSMNVTSPPPVRRSDSAIEDRFGALIDGDFLQLRKLPAPDENGTPIRQVLLIPPEDFVLHEIWSGPGHLELCQVRPLPPPAQARPGGGAGNLVPQGLLGRALPEDGVGEQLTPRAPVFHFPQAPGAKSLFISLKRRALAPLAWLTRLAARRRGRAGRAAARPGPSHVPHRASALVPPPPWEEGAGGGGDAVRAVSIAPARVGRATFFGSSAGPLPRGLRRRAGRPVGRRRRVVPPLRSRACAELASFCNKASSPAGPPVPAARPGLRRRAAP